MRPSMSSRERMRHVFRCEPTDRMPIRLWGVDPMFPSARPSWEPLYAMTEEFGLDQIRSWSPKAEEQDEPLVQYHSQERECPKPDLREIETVMETPAGPLSQVYYAPKDGSPGYVHKYFIETVEDARRWLSVPLRKTGVRVDSYFELERRSGDSALLMIGLGEAMYAVQAMMGSEIFGYWLIDERNLLHEMIDRAYAGIEDAAKHYLAHNLGDCYGWVGPELCIPPLASPQDFHEFVFAYDKRIIDLAHDAGKLVWVHCHGDMHPVLEGFAEMGVDCLNPIEPPPIGKLTLADAKRRANGRMCLEGGVQNGDFQILEPEEMAKVTEAAVAQGKPGGGYILSSTSDPSTWVSLSEKIIANHRAFVETGSRLATYD
ncbi:MAG: hypothetical protein IT210_15620 [Armatimonadetes bacterium]|nr:hypothetical protein [Armatimonadota bacterium]